MIERSREYRIYLALWRKAFQMDDPLEIELKTVQEAISMKTGLYRAISPFREEREIDEELKDAAEVMSIKIKEKTEGGVVLEISRKVALEAAEAALVKFGLTEDDLLSVEEKAANESLKKLIPSNSPPAPELRVINPFYKKEE